MATVAAYFDINTGSAEREAEAAGQSISRSFFHVSNLIGVTFSNSSGQSIKVTDSDNRPADITYFTFRSNVSANTVDCCAPNKSLALEFSLRLPQTISQSALPSTTTPLSVSTSRSVPDSPQPVEDLAFTLGNLSDDILSSMDSDELLKLVIKDCDTISVVPSPTIQPFAPSNLFSTPQSTPPQSQSNTLSPKMDRVRKSTQSGDIMTYTGSLLFFDSQDVFDDIFGSDLTMLNLIPRKRGQCANENTDYLLSKVNDFCDLCCLHIFCDSIQLKYVRTDVYDSQKMLADILSHFRRLKWFILFAVKIFLSLLMTYLVVSPLFCLCFHRMRCLGHSV